MKIRQILSIFGVVGIALTYSSTVDAAMLKRNVKANRTTVIYLYVRYNPNTCGANAAPKYKVKSVEHGKIVGTKGGFKLESGLCKGRYMKGLSLKYTPKRGFRGLDKAKVILTMPTYVDDSGSSSKTLNFQIRVK